mmetsp:Transcript_11062/g.21656  ORF Transcript_11062/g.21656 Transcript_11062/m.21656 type:complete len:388 (-) Transcript_11062:1508-2671(-)
MASSPLADRRSMSALVLNRGQLEAVPLPIPNPLKNQVLIRVEAAAVTPLDAMFVRGRLTLSRKMPAIPGIEGAGVVVKNGGSLTGWRLVGKRVAFYAVRPHEQGCWAEYVAVSAKFCVVLQDTISFAEGCFLHVEPLTVLMIAEKVYQAKSKGIIHTLGSTSLGMLLLRYCQANTIHCINVCVRPEDEAAFKGIAADYIIDPQSQNYELRLTLMLYDLGVKTFVDGVGGPNAGFILQRMPPDSAMYLLTSLSGMSIGEIPISCFTEQNKKIEGANMPMWLNAKNMLGVKFLYKYLYDNIMVFQPKIEREFNFDQATEACEAVEALHSSCKIVVLPKFGQGLVSDLCRGDVLRGEELAGDREGEGEEEGNPEDAHETPKAEAPQEPAN